MTVVWNRRIMLVLTAVVALWCGCETCPVQPHSPNANNSILWKYILGEEESWSWIDGLVLDSEMNLYFTGNLDYVESIGKVSSSGHLEWSYATNMFVYEIYMINFPSLSSSEALLICGGMDTNGNDYPDIGVVRILGLNGSVLAESYIEEEDSKLTIYEALVLEERDSELIVSLGGCVKQGGVYYPYMHILSVSNAGEFSKIRSKIFYDYPDKSIEYLTWNGNSAAPNYFAVIEHNVSSKRDWTSIFCYSDSLDVLWSVKAKPREASKTYFFQIRYYQGMVYVVGAALIYLNDAYEWTGSASGVTETGDVVWARIIKPSGKTDILADIYVGNEGCYAVGSYSRVRQESTNHMFGYGLLTAFEPATGAILFYRSFGGYEYYSSFIDICVADGRIFCVGNTQYYLKDYWCKGWMVEVSSEDGASQLHSPVILDSSETDRNDTSPLIDDCLEHKKSL